MREQIDVIGATLPFFTYIIDDITYYEFDSSESMPPEPMVNAMRGLALLKTDKEILVMINAQEPTPFFEKIKNDFSWEVECLESEDFKIRFRRR